MFLRKDELQAWDRFAAVGLNKGFGIKTAAEKADQMIEERRKRWGSRTDCEPDRDQGD